MTENGFVYLHRNIIEWDWWDDHNTTRLFIYCLMKANHLPANWRGVVIDRGSFVTSRDSLAKATGLSPQETRTCLKKLKKTKNLTIKTTSRFSIVSVCDYSLYQNGGVKATSNPTNKQPTSNQQATTNNNNNNNNKDIKGNACKKEFEKPSDVQAQTWEDFKILRQSKKAPITQTAMDNIRREANKINWTMEMALTEMCARTWIGFRAQWIINEQKQNPETTAATPAETGEEEINAQLRSI